MTLSFSPRRAGRKHDASGALPWLFPAVLALVLALPAPIARADYAAGMDAWEAGNYKAAVQEFARAARAGDMRAANRLGGFYERGDGVRRDYAKAAALYRRAAEHGLRAAEYNLARMYRNGHGVPQDDVLSAEWYRKAAMQGLSIAQFFVGKNYEYGQGVPQDYAQAYIWFSLAAAQEEMGSDEALTRMASYLSQAQIAGAHAEALALARGMRLPRRALARLASGHLSVSPVPSSGGLASSGVAAPATASAAAPGTTAGAISSAGSATHASTPPVARQPAAAAAKVAELAPPGVNAAVQGAPPATAAKRAQPAVTGQGASRNAAKQGPPSAASGTGAGSRPLRLTNALIRDLQTSLDALGFDAGRPDGLAGRHTRRAIIAFQRAHDLPPTGAVTRALLAAVQGAGKPGGRTVAPAPPPAGSVAGIRAAQERLAALGFDPGRADGALGPHTRHALERWQRANGMRADGRLGAAVYARLMAVPPAARSASAPPQRPSTRTLAGLSRTEKVLAVQQRLAALGFDPGPQDGVMGAHTRRALRAWQKSVGIPADGELSDALFKRLFTVVTTPSAVPTAATAPPRGVALVRAVQRLLAAVGYDAGPVDGAAGPHTRAAVERWQRANGMRADGAVTKALYERLRSAPVAADRTLVKRLQRALARAGERPGPADGVMGARTKAAITAYRKRAGLRPGSDVDAALLQHLGIAAR